MRERDLRLQTSGCEDQFRPAVEFVDGSELDQPGAKAAGGRLLHLRAILLFPAQPETMSPGASSSFRQPTRTCPAGVDSAPCLTALVASSCMIRHRGVTCPGGSDTGGPPSTVSRGRVGAA